MPKFKVGESVRIRKNLEKIDVFSARFTVGIYDAMVNKEGTVQKIDKIELNQEVDLYKIGKWWYKESMLHSISNLYKEVI